MMPRGPLSSVEADLSSFQRRALMDARWRDAPEYQKMIRVHGAVAVPVIVMISLSVVLFVLTVQRVFEVNLGATLTLLAFTAGYVGIAYIVLDRTRRRRRFEALWALNMADELQNRERDLAESGEPLSLAALWSVTQDRIEYYHQIVTSQSEVSFRNGAITSYLGFGLLVMLAVVSVFTAGNLAVSVTLGVLGAIGAALSGFLGATFIRLHSESSAQLREFFSQPVEFSKLLGAERLIDSLPEEDRAAAVHIVLGSIMQTTNKS
jgi:hypothetical protein